MIEAEQEYKETKRLKHSEEIKEIATKYKVAIELDINQRIEEDRDKAIESDLRRKETIKENSKVVLQRRDEGEARMIERMEDAANRKEAGRAQQERLDTIVENYKSRPVITGSKVE